MTLRETCPNCGAALSRDQQYRCPNPDGDCGIDLTGEEKTTTGRDQR